MEKNNHKNNISIRNSMIFMFLLAMLLSISSIGYMVFSNWFRSASNTTERIAFSINEDIYNKIHSFMHGPEHINEMNYPMIQNDIVDFTDENERDRFFVGVLNEHDSDIYSFSFGTESGEYYGAHRNESRAIEIIRNNANTGGNTWYYSINEDWTANKRIFQAGRFDPRTSEWYKAAVKADGPSFSPVYKHSVMDDMVVSATRPIVDKDGELRGVMGTHMFLSDIGSYLTDTVRDYNGYSIIFEKSTGALIANSMGLDNFNVSPDGTLGRYNIRDIENTEISQAYDQFITNQDPQFLYKGKGENQYINFKELSMGGLDWVIVSAIPEDLLLSDVVDNIHLTMLMAVAALLLSFVLYYAITNKVTQPMYQLLHVSEAISSGDLFQRVPIVRNNEIGKISASFNEVADKMQYIIDNLEATVDKRTAELYESTEILNEKREQLRLILDSAGEGIYGNDTEGNCTFCNLSSIKMLGYSGEEDLLGKNMHIQIHHSRRDGKPYPADECKILHSIGEGKGVHVDDEVFWRADGTYIEVEYRSYPQIRNGEIIGSVITFTDITERKEKEERINYLSYHDTLTGLYNRQYFSENLRKVDNADNLPLSVIFADINGLKMMNDIFGHAAGDSLIKKSAEVLVQSCRQNDIIVRVGGDEYIILLPKADNEKAQKILSRIRNGFSKAKFAAIKCSISIGADTKTSDDQSIEEIIANAENAMYKDKSMNRKAINKDIIDTIIDTLHSESPREKQHSEVVSQLCGDIGAALSMTDTEINKLKRAGYLHDIGKIVLAGDVLLKDILEEDDLEEVQQHSIVGYRILNLFDDTLDLAEYVYNHHESWDGKGYPKGLKGEEIPQISRIISIAETYERVLRREAASNPKSKEKAIQIIKNEAGKRFDPKIVELFVQMMESDVS